MVRCEESPRERIKQANGVAKAIAGRIQGPRASGGTSVNTKRLGFNRVILLARAFLEQVLCTLCA